MRKCWETHAFLSSSVPANSGWELQGAVAINVAGQIVGIGTIKPPPHCLW